GGGGLRQRRRRLDLREQGARGPRGTDSRPFLSGAGSRGRSHEHHLHRWPHRGRVSGLGSRGHVPGLGVQRGAAASPAAEQGRKAGARTEEDGSMSTTGVTTPTTAAELDQLAVNTIRTLSIDAVERAKSGHPGTPMALAPLVYTIWNRVMRFDPDD